MHSALPQRVYVSFRCHLSKKGTFLHLVGHLCQVDVRISSAKMQSSTRSQDSIAPGEAENSVVTPHIKKYHRSREDAARLGVSLRTYATWLAERRIPHFKVGRCVLVDPVAVDKALNKFRVGPATEPKRRAKRINPEMAA